MSALIISVKQEIANKVDPLLAIAFRQIENWGNANNWISVGVSPVFNTNWSSYGLPFQRVRFRKELYDAVRLDGLALFAGTINTTTASTIFTLPATYRPIAEKGFPLIFPNTGGGIGPDWRLNVLPSGLVQVENFTGNNVTNPYVFLDGITFPLT